MLGIEERKRILTDSPEKGKGRDGTGRISFRLTARIVALSESDTWDGARREWDLSDRYRTEPDDPGVCLCGHAIREHCVLVNRLSGHEAVVGNCCVVRFLGLPSAQVFAGLDRIRKDPAAAPSPALVEYARSRCWLTDFELRHLRGTARSRRLSPRQLAVRIEVNKKILRHVAASGSGVGRA